MNYESGSKPHRPWNRSPNYTLRQIQYALAIQKEGGFGRAAKACGVSQPSLSSQVAKLEATLGVPIFERRPSGVVPTKAGQQLLVEMRLFAESCHRLEGVAKSVSDPFSVVLRVGVIPTVAPYLVPPIANALATASPRPSVHWLELQTAVCEQALETGDIDAMLIADPPSNSRWKSAELGFERFRLLVPTSHPLKDPAQLEDLRDAPLLLLQEGHCLRAHTQALCMMPGVAESPYRATSMSTLVQMVVGGFGVTVIPASAGGENQGGLRSLPFVDPDIGRRLRLIWHPRAPHPHVLESLVVHARAALQDVLTRLD